MVAEPARWVMDTSTFTHFWRAGHSQILMDLAPGGLVLVPSEVNVEIDQGCALHPEIPPVRAVEWAELVVCDDDEQLTLLGVKADMGGGPTEHLGECAVIACALWRSGIAILDERKAIEQAGLRDMNTHDSMWIAVHAYALLFDRDRDRTAAVIDDLLATGMKLPITSGASFMQWAYENELLPYTFVFGGPQWPAFTPACASCRRWSTRTTSRAPTTRSRCVGRPREAPSVRWVRRR